MRQIISGAEFSVISTGVLRTPDGKAGAIKTVLTRTTSRAACIEGVDHERLTLAAGDHAAPAEEYRAEQAGRSFRRDIAAQRFFQATEHDVGQHLADGMAGRHSGGPRSIQNAALRRSDAHDPQRSGVVGHVVTTDHAAHAERGVSLGIGQRHVDAVAADRGGALKIHVDAGCTDGQSADEFNRFVITVDAHRVAPGSKREFANPGEHGVARIFDDHVGRAVQAIQAKLPRVSNRLAAPAWLLAASE